MDHPDPWAPLGHRALEDHRDRTDNAEPKDHPDPKAPKDHKANQHQQHRAIPPQPQPA